MRNKIMVLLAVLMMIAAAVSATIVDVTENPEYPTPAQNVVICAEVTDVPSLVTSVVLDWDNGIESGNFSMNDPDGDNVFCRTLSATTILPVNGMTVTYDITSMNASGVDDTASGDYTYDDEDPVSDAGGPYFCNEGDLVAGDLDGSNSDDNLGIANYSWVTNSGGIFTDPTVQNPEFRCYTGDGDYIISLTVTDFGGRFNTDTADLTVTNVAPIADAGGPYICSEGQAVQNNGGKLDGSGSSDPGLDNLEYAWDLNTNVDSSGDGIPNNDVDSTEAEPNYICGDGAQTIPIALTVSDEEESTTDTSQISIINGAPRITNMQVTTGTIFEGTQMNLRVDFTDIAADTHEAVIDWGDSTADTVVDPATTPFNSVHTYVDGDSSPTITVTVTDDDSSSDTDTLDITVNNVAPGNDAGGPYNAELDLAFCDFAGSATDPGVLDTLTYEWDFDYDGVTFDVDATGVDLTSPCNTYGALGDYTVGLRVFDGEDYSGIDTTTVTVWNYVIDLHTGWNLISIPLVPLDENGDVDTSIENVLIDPLGSALADDVTYPILSFQFVGDFTNANVWLQSTITGTGNDTTLTEVVPGYAYWIKIDEATLLTGNGQELSSWGLPPEVSLQTLTWNLIGKYGNTEVDKGDQTEDLGYNDPDMRDLADYSVVEVDDTDLSQGDYLEPSDAMMPKEGYWTFMGGNSFFTEEPVRYIPSAADYS